MNKKIIIFYLSLVITGISLGITSSAYNSPNNNKSNKNLKHDRSNKALTYGSYAVPKKNNDRNIVEQNPNKSDNTKIDVTATKDLNFGGKSNILIVFDMDPWNYLRYHVNDISDTNPSHGQIQWHADSIKANSVDVFATDTSIYFSYIDSSAFNTRWTNHTFYKPADGHITVLELDSASNKEKAHEDWDKPIVIGAKPEDQAKDQWKSFSNQIGTKTYATDGNDEDITYDMRETCFHALADAFFNYDHSGKSKIDHAGSSHFIGFSANLHVFQ